MISAVIVKLSSQVIITYFEKIYKFFLKKVAGEFMKIEKYKSLVGNTPFAQIVCRVNGKLKNIFAKLEWYNLSGSIKDRVAFYILNYAIKNKCIQKGQSIVEVTSGNTGISFCAFGALLGYKIEILMPEWMSDERKKLMKSYGANLRLLSKEEGGFLKGLELLKTDYKNEFLPLQFENRLNVNCHYYTTGKEICKALFSNDIVPDNFVAGVGTGGTLIGCAKRLKKDFKDIKVYAMEPASSPTLKVGKKVGVHLIEGISDDFVPKIYNPKLVDDIVDVGNEEAIYFANLLAKKLGLAVGISSGANFASALKLDGNTVTIFADDNKKYLSTHLCKPNDYKPDFDFELIDMKIL